MHITETPEYESAPEEKSTGNYEFLDAVLSLPDRKKNDGQGRAAAEVAGRFGVSISMVYQARTVLKTAGQNSSKYCAAATYPSKPPANVCLKAERMNRVRPRVNYGFYNCYVLYFYYKDGNDWMSRDDYYILKHKNINVADIVIRNGDITDVVNIYEPEHLPYKYIDDKFKNISLLNSWVEHRGIPFSREDYEAVMEEFNVSSSKELTVLSYGLNLTDHYWLCEKNNERKWEDVNFFDNKFSERIGRIMPELAEKYRDFINPDLSSNGRLKKFWIINNGKRELCKAGSGDLKQEPFNEVIASQIAGRLNIDYVNYELKKHDNEIYCKCGCMIDKNVEFVNSFIVYLETEKTGDKYNDYLNACAKMGINNAREEVDKMIVLDYLIRNTDRNAGNFGILRNSETLKWEKIAPVFDNGNSFWHNAQGVKFINGDSKSECRSFTGENEKNVLMIGGTKWYDKSKLYDADKIIAAAFKHNEYIENERIDKIINEFKKRVNNLSIVLERGMRIYGIKNDENGRSW